MIRLAVAADLPQIKSLWMQAFHDSAEATNFYFENRMPRDKLLGHLLIDEQEGRLRGMLSMLPVDLVSGGSVYPARYFFAIATDERFRRMGISTGLIEHAQELAMESGCYASLLVPASKELFLFYAKRGYIKLFSYAQAVFAGSDLMTSPENARLLPNETEALLRIRDKAFGRSGLYARWDLEALDFVIKAATAWDAPLIRFATDTGEGYAYCEPDDDSFTVKELALCGIELNEAMSIVHRELGAGSYNVRLPASCDPLFERVPYGMIRWIKAVPFRDEEAPPYLGLGKD